MPKRTLKEINEIGWRALISALGEEDADTYLAQFREKRPRPDAEKDAETLPPLDANEAHELIRDIQDPLNQQHML